MGKPIACANDSVIAVDTHIVIVPAGPAQIPTPLPHPFNGLLNQQLATSVTSGGRAVALQGSIATNQPAHIPTPPGVVFQKPPANQGTVAQGSASVKIEGAAIARAGDPVRTCNDPADLPVGQIIAFGAVLVGG